MNFNKLYAALCGLSSITIFITYLFVYFNDLESYTELLKQIVLSISSLAFVASFVVLCIKFKMLFSKDYIYTTIILIFISCLSMWYNQFLFFRM